MENYLNTFPTDMLSWLEGFCEELDCPEPNPLEVSGSEYFKRYGAWETQQLIMKKLKYAINVEKNKSKIK